VSEHNGSQAAERNRNSSRVPTLEDLENYRPDADYDTPQPTKRPRQNGRQNGRRAAAVPAVPYDPDIERAALAAAILDTTGQAAAAIEPKLFLSDHHRKIASHLRRIEKPDLTLLIASLRDAGELEDIGGWPAMEAIVKGVGTFADWPYYVNKLRSYWADRCRLEAITDAQANPSRETAKALQQRLAEIEAAEATKPSSLICLAEVQPRTVDWLWPSRIALGRLTVLSGEPGLGKSFLTCDLAARVSTGMAWPDDRSSVGEPGAVMLLTAEDDLADTIAPRLIAAGADLGRVYSDTSPRRLTDPADIEAIEAAATSIEGLRLMVIDPVSAYLGDADSWKDADVRTALRPLSDLAAKHRFAVVLVAHLNKGNGSAINRTQGSIALVAAARTAWLVTRDRENPRRRLMTCAKNNIGLDVGGLAYEIVEGYHGPIVGWEPEPITETADEALGNHSSRREDREAKTREAIEHARAAILCVLEGSGPMSKTKLAIEATGSRSKAFQAAFDQLEASGAIEPCEIITGNNGRKDQGYRLVSHA